MPRSTVGYWARTKLIEPSYRRSRQRLYTFQDVRDLIVAGRLRSQGAKVRDLRAALTYVRSVDDVRRLAHANFVISNGMVLYVNEDKGLPEDSVVNAAKRGHRVFRLDMSEVFEQMGATEGNVTRLRPADRIVVDPNVRGGTPVIEGTRIPAVLVADLLDEGLDIADVIELYPTLKPADVKAARDYRQSLKASLRKAATG